MKLITYIKNLLFIFLTFLLGTYPTHAKTEVIIPTYEQVFVTTQPTQKTSIQKVVPPNIGFLKEKTKFVAVEGVSAQNFYNFSKQSWRYLANTVDDLASFMSKSLSDKLAYIDNIWNTKYPIPDMLGGRSFLEDIMGQYRYTQSSGWLHTGDISFNFKGIDFYKGTENANQIFANTAVSMKTTIQTDVNTWLNYTSIQDNIRFLREGMSSTGMVDPNNLKTMFITDAKIHIYMPKANITPSLKTQWMSKLNTDYPDIDFEIKAIEDFIN